MFNRTQRQVSEGSKHWYQDKYQHVLTQRNILALIALVSLLAAAASVLAVARLAPLKSVEPYLLEIDEKSGITQRVNPISREEYTASEAVDKYFTALYIRMREGYNVNSLAYNYNVVGLMSTKDVLGAFRSQINPNLEGSLAKRLGALGQRDVRIRSIAYVPNMATKNKKDKTVSRSKTVTVRILAVESQPNMTDRVEPWIATITFEYANLSLSQDAQLLNPLGYLVTSYQIQPETL